MQTLYAASSTAPHAGADRPHPATEYLRCCVGGVHYGIDVDCVQELRSYEPPAPIANAPPVIKGVLNLRGVIMPIIDLCLRLHGHAAACTTATVVVVLKVRGRAIGVMVDSVSEVQELEPRAEYAAAPAHLGCATPFITGVANLAGCSVSLVDIDALLAGADMGLLGPAAALLGAGMGPLSGAVPG